ncbi:Uncharacterized protein OBRU01_25479, partial [Operophtera brumata]
MFNLVFINLFKGDETRRLESVHLLEQNQGIDLKFNEKFYGVAYADFDRHSACQVAGKGALSYKLELPLKGCGTKQ